LNISILAVAQSSNAPHPHPSLEVIDQPLKYIASSFKEEEALNLHCYKVLFNQMSDQSFESLPKSQY